MQEEMMSLHIDVPLNNKTMTGEAVIVYRKENGIIKKLEGYKVKFKKWKTITL